MATFNLFKLLLSLFLNLLYGTTQYGNKKWSTISSRLRTVTQNRMWTHPQQQAGKLNKLAHRRVASCTTGALDCAKGFSSFFSIGSKHRNFKKRKRTQAQACFLPNWSQGWSFSPLSAEFLWISWTKLMLMVEGQAKQTFLYESKTHE